MHCLFYADEADTALADRDSSAQLTEVTTVLAPTHHSLAHCHRVPFCLCLSLCSILPHFDVLILTRTLCTTYVLPMFATMSASYNLSFASCLLFCLSLIAVQLPTTISTGIVNGYCNGWSANLSCSLHNLHTHRHAINSLAISSYHLSPAGLIVPCSADSGDCPFPTDVEQYNARVVHELPSLSVVPLVFDNDGKTVEQTRAMWSNGHADTNIALLVNRTLTYNYTGLSMDWEPSCWQQRPSQCNWPTVAESQAYTGFLTRLSAAFVAVDRVLTVCADHEVCLPDVDCGGDDYIKHCMADEYSMSWCNCCAFQTWSTHTPTHSHTLYCHEVCGVHAVHSLTHSPTLGTVGCVCWLMVCCCAGSMLRHCAASLPNPTSLSWSVEQSTQLSTPLHPALHCTATTHSTSSLARIYHLTSLTCVVLCARCVLCCVVLCWCEDSYGDDHPFNATNMNAAVQPWFDAGCTADRMSFGLLSDQALSEKEASAVLSAVRALGVKRVDIWSEPWTWTNFTQVWSKQLRQFIDDNETVVSSEKESSSTSVQHRHAQKRSKRVGGR